jgi:hypothetical protein
MADFTAMLVPLDTMVVYSMSRLIVVERQVNLRVTKGVRPRRVARFLPRELSDVSSLRNFDLLIFFSCQNTPPQIQGSWRWKIEGYEHR